MKSEESQLGKDLDILMTYDLRRENREREQIRRQNACLKACEGISTHALEYGVIGQLVEAVEEAKKVLDEKLQYPHISREWELLHSRLRLVLSKLNDKEPE